MAGVTGKLYMPVSLLDRVKGILTDAHFVCEEKSEFHVVHATHFTRAMADCFVNAEKSRLAVILHNNAELLLKDSIMALDEGVVYEPAKEVLQKPS